MFGVCDFAAVGADEHKFPVLQIGTQEYKNVTVTTKAKDYIFILHSTGMTNIKVAELPENLRAELGYEGPAAKEKKAAVWSGAGVPKFDKAEMEKIEKQLNAALGPGRKLPPMVSLIQPWMIYAFLGGCFLAYLFFCYCSMLICAKTGNQAGLLVWLPILQMIPLLKAAGMSPAWFLAMFVPLLNLVVPIIWSFKIVTARSKGPAIAIMLLLPLFNVIAYLYLAFSDGATPAKSSEKRADTQTPELMTLETA
jgi:hypothetical protein